MNVPGSIIVFALAIFVCSAQTIVPELQWTPDPMCPYPSDKIVYFPYPYNCSQYWECYEGKKYLKDCPENLWWHQEASVCDYPENVNCVASTSTSDVTTTTTEGTTSSSEATTTSSEGTTASTDTTTWSTESTEPPTTQSSGAPTTRSSLCPDDSVISYEPYPYDCNKFVECNYGIPKILKCPDGLHWNVKAKSCDFPQNAHCEPSTSTSNSPTTTTTERTTETTTTSTSTVSTTESTTTTEGTTTSTSTEGTTTTTASPTTKSSLCPEESGLFYHAYPYDCNKFVECNNGHANILSCPNKLEWNDAAKSCDFPENANCKVSTSVKPATQSYWN